MEPDYQSTELPSVKLFAPRREKDRGRLCSPPDNPAPRTWTERMDSSDMDDTKASRSESRSGECDLRFGERERRGGELGRVGDAGSDTG